MTRKDDRSPEHNPNKGYNREKNHIGDSLHKPKQPLDRGSGRDKILFLDTFSGIAGDMLVAAFTGNSWRDIYNYALKNDFRFLSYGDCSLLIAD